MTLRRCLCTPSTLFFFKLSIGLGAGNRLAFRFENKIWNKMDLPIFHSVLYVIHNVFVNISDKFLIFCTEKTIAESIQFDRVFLDYPPFSKINMLQMYDHNRRESHIVSIHKMIFNKLHWTAIGYYAKCLPSSNFAKEYYFI